MTDNFAPFADIVHQSLQFILAHDEVFVVDAHGDALYEVYLDSFPEGTNPIFRERTEHDCSCCKSFIRRAANLVAIAEDGTIHTVWDDAAEKGPDPYKLVSTVLRDLVMSKAISSIFRTKEGAFGAKKTRSQTPEYGVEVFHHFYSGEIPQKFKTDTPDEAKGKYRTTSEVFERGLTELSAGALELMVELIGSKSVYRGEEQLPAITSFQALQKKYEEAEDKNLFVWLNAGARGARFRNSAVGTLAVDLSEGKDVEESVVAFGKKMDPANYKRPTRIVTPGMVKEAMKTLEELGLEPALDRRFAVIGDIGINDVLWADGSVKSQMKGGIGDVLMEHVQATRDVDTDRAEDIDIEDFLTSVVPEAKSMELLFKGDGMKNLMSLTAPVSEDVLPQLFKWKNGFGWSYAGNIADSSIKERVKAAGGKVTGVELRTSLSWFNSDDLDIHVIEPSGSRISYRSMYGSDGGHLDVDMNVQTSGPSFSRQAVENVVWRKVKDGAYKVIVHNYTHRESQDIGFVIEMENAGKLSHFNYPKEVRGGQEVHVATLHVKGGKVVSAEPGDSNITSSSISQEKWGIKTETFVRVNALTISPNFWDDNAVGNKHHFFVVDGCLNDEPCRGIYNEFLHPRLEPHRKVFELIGEKTKCQPTEGQLSGLGFSSTKKDSVIVKVMQGQKQRLFNVQIGA
jgi:hypothetical protein